MRRWFKIAAGVLLLVLVIAVLGVLVFLESPRLDKLAQTEIKKYLENRFFMRVEIGDVDVRPLRTEFELRNFRLFSLNEPARPAISIDRIVLDFRITRVFKPGASMDSLLLVRPRIVIVEEANTRLNFSNMFAERRKRAPGKPFSITRLAIKRLYIRDGLILFHDRPIHVETSDGGLSGEWRFDETGQRKYVGNLDLQHLTVAVNEFQLSDTTGQVDFKLLDDQLDLPRVVIRGREATAHVSGQFSTLRGRTFRFDTDIDANVPLIRHPDFGRFMHEGQFHMLGVFRGDRSGFSWTGTANTAFMDFAGFPFYRVQSSVVLTRDGVQVNRLQANLHGGTVNAHGVLRWDQRSRFDVDGSGIRIYPLLTQLDVPQVKVRGLGHFSGVFSWPGLEVRDLVGQGRGYYRGEFAGLSNTETPETPVASAVQSAAESPTAIEAAIPFHGNSRVTLRNETFHFSDGVISLPKSEVGYSGDVTLAGRYQLDFDVKSSDGNELLSIAQSMGLAPEPTLREYRVDVPGPVAIQARLSGEGNQPEVSGLVDAAQVHMFDRLMGRLRSGIRVNRAVLELTDAELTGPDYTAAATGQIRLQDTSDVFNAARIRVENLPIERFLPILRPDLDLSGRLFGQVAFEEKSRGLYAGGGGVRVTSASGYEEHAENVTADISFEGRNVALRNVRGSFAGGQVGGQLALNLQTKSVTADLNGRDLKIEQIRAVQKRKAVSGLLNFSIRGSGTRENPSFDVIVSSPAVAITEQYSLERVELTAQVRGERADFKLQNWFRGKPFQFQGEMSLKKPYLVDATVRLEQVPIEPYLALLGKDLPKLAGMIDGQARIQGPMEDPESMVGQATLTKVSVTVENYSVENAQQVNLSYTAGLLRIPRVTFRGPQTELQLEGSVNVREPRNLNLRVDGTVNLLLLSGFMSEGSSSGQVQLNTVIAGTLSRPRVVGTASLKDGLLTHPSLPTGIFDAEGTFKFTANQVSIDAFTARTAYGRVQAEGGVFLEGFRPTRWQVNISGEGLRLEYPTDVDSVVDLDLDAVKSQTSQLLSGVVFIRSSEYTRTISIAELILAFTGAGSEDVHGNRGGGQTLLNIDVEAYQSIRISNNLADVTASGDFTLRGTLDDPVILGTITVDEGVLRLENNDYEVTRGTVTFNNPRRTRPVLAFEAETDVQDYTISVGLRGPLEQLKVSFRSDPPLPTASIVTLIAVGQTQQELGIGPTSQRQVGDLAVQGAVTLLSKSLGEQVEARASRLFGFERLSIDPFLSQTGRDPSARITLGKQLTKGLTVTYSTDLGNAQQGQIVSLEYKLTDWLTAIGTREQDGSLAVDFKFRKRF